MYTAVANGVAIPAGVYLTTQTQKDQVADGYLGIVVFMDITNYVDGTFTLEIDAKDPSSGLYTPILIGAGQAGNGLTVYKIYPGLIPVDNAVANDVLTESW